MSDDNLIDCCFGFYDTDRKTLDSKNYRDDAQKPARRSKSRRQRRKVKKTPDGYDQTGKKLIIFINTGN